MKTVLIIEDNEKNMYLFNFILTKAGYTVIKAETGEEGIEIAMKEKPDFILMDIKLPGIDGLETTRRIRKLESGDKIPIIAITSYAMTGDKKKALDAGCTGYIEKPINSKTFLSKIEKYIK